MCNTFLKSASLSVELGTNLKTSSEIMASQTYLVADIGGTKTALAVYSRESGPRQILKQVTFPSKDYPSLEAVLTAFLADNADLRGHLLGAVFGVAGPVVAGRAQITNLPWVIDASRLGQLLACPVYLLNDLEVIANAVPFLTGADLATINAGQPVPTMPIAVIAPGTGLGEAYLTWNPDRNAYIAHPSEGGHTDFAPTTPTELALLTYLQPKFGHVSYERVCSGSGIPNLYEFLRDSGRYPEPPLLKGALAKVSDPTPVIMRAATDEQPEQRADIALAALDLFVSILAGEASNLALKIMATGGVFLGGGIPPRILQQLHAPTFMNMFANKGRFENLMSKVPVNVIIQPDVALLGSSLYFQQLSVGHTTG